MVNAKPFGRRACFPVLFLILCLLPARSRAGAVPEFHGAVRPGDVLLAAAPDGGILFERNASRPCIPASTLKLLTSLAAFHYLGPCYRFRTELYRDAAGNLILKGYGDPLLISEAWREIAARVARKVLFARDLILDDTYFETPVIIPGENRSTNPYDAPVGALCANFNTIFFDTRQDGSMVSAEPQTPLIPYAVKKIRSLGLKRGRYTFTHDPAEATRYAGELFRYFLRREGIRITGTIRRGTAGSGIRPVLTYRSRFTLREAVGKMLKFSSNFMANQILLCIGARVYGPPGSLEKGVRAVREYARGELHLAGLNMVEGSGISRKNRLSARDMLAVLTAFRPYRHLLNRKGNILYKTGSLTGIRTRAGYVEKKGSPSCYFVVFLSREGPDADRFMTAIARFATRR